MKKQIAPRPWLFPRPVLLVSTRDAAGKDNIITISWAGVACSAPPMVTVALRRSRHSYAAIQASKEFVVNIPTTKQVALAEFCGSQSGKQTDKFAALSLEKYPSKVVNVPMIAVCPINLECQVKQVLPLGSHDLFLAEIVKVHAQHSVLREDGELDEAALEGLAWGSEEFFRVLRWRQPVGPASSTRLRPRVF
jgi:flavin reductase (DIM6/NTAB) family NADH-FMN oxidoreductase RutF